MVVAWRRWSAVLGVLAVVVAAVTVWRPGQSRAAPNQFVTMADGVQIALNVRLPDGFAPGRRYPTVFEMSGYDGGSAEDGTLTRDLARLTGIADLPAQDDSRQLTRMFDADYVTVHASIRGTGCSGGEFDLFSRRSALDGRAIIDDWIVNQPWSNGDVGLFGHSYGGITATMIAATRPAHLRAASVSGLVDDVYRGLVYPGGVSNFGFPLLWTLGFRPATDVAGGLLPGIARPEQADDPPGRQLQCLGNVATKSRTVLDDPLLQGLRDTDGPWYQSRSLINVIDQVQVPIHVAGAWQDQETGPRGFTHLWEKVAGVPKRLVVTNGNHATNQGPVIMADRKRWIDHWLRGVDGGFGTLTEHASSVTTLFELAGGQPNGTKDGDAFPYADTAWTDWYLHDGGRLSTTAPAGPEGADAYLSGTLRQSAPATAEGPDEVRYTSAPVQADTAIVGPATATVFATATAPDTEFFVQLVDVGPDGSRSFLQRGLLRASHRAFLDGPSDHTPDGRIYRPYRTHASPTPIVPAKAYEYLIEVFPLGHVLRAGHRLQAVIATPPLLDSLNLYVPRRVPSVTTVLHDASHPSRLLLPVVPLDGVTLGPPRPCGALDGLRCVPLA